MAGLRIENLSRSFAGAGATVRAIDRLTMDVADGELLVLLGPSGSGKTTLLRMIAGLEKPDSGDILLGGKSILKEGTDQRGIGMAFQYPALLPQLSVSENIALGMKLRGTPAAERSKRTRELGELLGISDLLARSPQTLSGGQQQRVSLGRALALRPALLLLDEPLANLDPSSRIDLRERVRVVQQQIGVTTIYVTHDQSEASAMSDRIAILEHGALQQIGSAASLYLDPANLFVAQFFAPERPNLLRGTIREKQFIANASQFVLPVAADSSGEAFCAIRPRALTIGGNLEGIVEGVRFNGWSTQFILNAFGAKLAGEFSGRHELRVGEILQFGIDPSGVFLFAPSGDRLR